MPGIKTYLLLVFLFGDVFCTNRALEKILKNIHTSGYFQSSNRAQNIGSQYKVSKRSPLPGGSIVTAYVIPSSHHHHHHVSSSSPGGNSHHSYSWYQYGSQTGPQTQISSLYPGYESRSFYKYNSNSGYQQHSYASSAPVIQNSPNSWVKYSYWKTGPTATNVWWKSSLSSSPVQQVVQTNYENPTQIWTIGSEQPNSVQSIFPEIPKIESENPIYPGQSDSGQSLSSDYGFSKPIDTQKFDSQNAEGYSANEYDYSPNYNYESSTSINKVALPLTALLPETSTEIFPGAVNSLGDFSKLFGNSDSKIISTEKPASKYPTYTEVKFKPYSKEPESEKSAVIDSYSLEANKAHKDYLNDEALTPPAKFGTSPKPTE